MKLVINLDWQIFSCTSFHNVLIFRDIQATACREGKTRVLSVIQCWFKHFTASSWKFIISPVINKFHPWQTWMLLQLSSSISATHEFYPSMGRAVSNPPPNYSLSSSLLTPSLPYLLCFSPSAPFPCITLILRCTPQTPVERKHSE